MLKTVLQVQIQLFSTSRCHPLEYNYSCKFYFMSAPIQVDNLSKSTTIHTKHIRGDMDDLQIHLTHNNLLPVYTALSDYLTLDIDSFNRKWDILYYFCKYSSPIYTWKHFWCKTRSIRWLASILSFKGSFLYVGLYYRSLNTLSYHYKWSSRISMPMQQTHSFRNSPASVYIKYLFVCWKSDGRGFNYRYNYHCRYSSRTYRAYR